METREVTTTTATTVATFEDKTGTPSRTGMQSPSMVVNSTGINQADEEEKKQQQIMTAEIDVTQTPSTLMKFTDEIQEQVESTNSNTEGGGERVAEEEAEIMDGLCSAVDEGPKNGEEENGKSNNNNVGMEEEAGTNVVDGSKSPESIFTPLRQTAKATTAASSTTTPQAEPMQKEATPTSILRKTSSPARKVKEENASFNIIFYIGTKFSLFSLCVSSSASKTRRRLRQELPTDIALRPS
jgi:hypothetical protein